MIDYKGEDQTFDKLIIDLYKSKSHGIYNAQHICDSFSFMINWKACNPMRNSNYFSKRYNEIHACTNYFWKKKKNIPWFQKPNPMKSSVSKTHPLNIIKKNHMNKMDQNIDCSTFLQSNNENQYWHERLLLLWNDEMTLMNNTTWLGS